MLAVALGQGNEHELCLGGRGGITVAITYEQAGFAHRRQAVRWSASGQMLYRVAPTGFRVVLPTWWPNGRDDDRDRTSRTTSGAVGCTPDARTNLARGLVDSGPNQVTPYVNEGGRMTANLKCLACVVALCCMLTAQQTRSSTRAVTSVPVAGEYQCDGCNGYLTIQRQGTAELRMTLEVRGGSCGSEPPLTRTLRYTGGVLTVPYSSGARQCAVHIEFVGRGAMVKDSCFTVQDEADSTCATLGAYTKRKQ